MQSNIKRDIFYSAEDNTTPMEIASLKSFHKAIEVLVPNNLKICAVVEKSKLHKSKKINLGVVTTNQNYNIESSSKDLPSLLTKVLSQLVRLKNDHLSIVDDESHLGSSLNFLDSKSFSTCPIEKNCPNLNSCPLRINRKYKVKNNF
jgi:hypothetical protein